jgi:hypothetical protein
MMLLFVMACSDYDLQHKAEEPPPERDETTPPEDTDTTPPVDTGDPPTGGGTVTDTEPEDPLVATEPVYINTAGTLYSYDPASNTATRLGNFDCTSEMTDIAVDLDGYMYGVAWNVLYEIDPTNGRCTRAATLSGDYNGLTFVSDGRLVGSGTTIDVLDPGTGRATALVSRGQFTTSGDIIGLPDGMLYWTVEGADDLVQVDPNSGSTTRVGRINVSGIWGLGYANEELYGFTSGGARVIIDETSASATDNDRLSGSWYGATTNPVLW